MRNSSNLDIGYGMLINKVISVICNMNAINLNHKYSQRQVRTCNQNISR